MSRIRELGYAIDEITSFDITSTLTPIDLEGRTGFLFNTTDGNMQYGLSSTATEEKLWNIAGKDVQGPLNFGIVYFKADVPGKLKIMFIRGI